MRSFLPVYRHSDHCRYMQQPGPEKEERDILYEETVIENFFQSDLSICSTGFLFTFSSLIVCFTFCSDPQFPGSLISLSSSAPATIGFFVMMFEGRFMLFSEHIIIFLFHQKNLLKSSYNPVFQRVESDDGNSSAGFNTCRLLQHLFQHFHFIHFYSQCLEYRPNICLGFLLRLAAKPVLTGWLF